MFKMSASESHLTKSSGSRVPEAPILLSHALLASQISLSSQPSISSSHPQEKSPEVSMVPSLNDQPWDYEVQNASELESFVKKHQSTDNELMNILFSTSLNQSKEVGSAEIEEILLSSKYEGEKGELKEVSEEEGSPGEVSSISSVDKENSSLASNGQVKSEIEAQDAMTASKKSYHPSSSKPPLLPRDSEKKDPSPDASPSEANISLLASSFILSQSTLPINLSRESPRLEHAYKSGQTFTLSEDSRLCQKEPEIPCRKQAPRKPVEAEEPDYSPNIL